MAASVCFCSGSWGSAAAAASGAVAAGVGHPVIAAAAPEPSIQTDPFGPAEGKQSSEGFGIDPADQIQYQPPVAQRSSWGAMTGFFSLVSVWR